VRNIGDALNDAGISWAYFGDQFNRYLIDKYDASKLNEYCNICNFFQYSTSIMTNATVRKAHLKDTADLYASIASGGPLPAVSYVKPSGFVDGHPASSKLNLFEGFVKKIVDLVNANPTISADTAIRRRRRILGFGLYPAARFLWRRHPNPPDRGVAIQHGRPHLAHLYGSCLNAQVHRSELGPHPDHQAEPGQSAQPPHRV
jgi:hypothetical protein